jgi:ferredoxin
VVSAGQIEIVPGRCIGAGNCVDVAGKYFDQSDDDATVIVLSDMVDDGDLPQVAQALNVCPVAAIKLRDSVAVEQ